MWIVFQHQELTCIYKDNNHFETFTPVINHIYSRIAGIFFISITIEARVLINTSPPKHLMATTTFLTYMHISACSEKVCTMTDFLPLNNNFGVFTHSFLGE